MFLAAKTSLAPTEWVRCEMARPRTAGIGRGGGGGGGAGQSLPSHDGISSVMSVVGPIAAKKLQGRECSEVFLLQQNSLVI